MTDDLHLSQRAFGLASGIFFCAYAALQIPSNHALPTVGATRILSACMIGWGACSAATSLVGGETSLLALRFALGLAEAGFTPGVLPHLTRWFPEAVSSEALALFSTAASVGSFVSSAGSGALMTAMDGVGGVRGWRWLLLLQGLPSVLLGLLAPLALTDSPERAAWLERGERAALLAALRRGDEAAAPTLRRRRRRRSALRSVPRASARRAGRLRCSTLASLRSQILAASSCRRCSKASFLIGRRGRLASYSQSLPRSTWRSRRRSPRGRIATATAAAARRGDCAAARR